MWGVAERHQNTVAKVNKGDKLLMYLKQEKIDEELVPSRIAGVYEVTSEVFEDHTRIFKVPKGMGNETFPLRIRIKPIDIFKEPVGFKPLIPRLKFITNKKKWGGHLMGKAMRPITEGDFEVITGKVS